MEEKKVWYVVDVPSDSAHAVEKKLNELAADGLQVFRIDELVVAAPLNSDGTDRHYRIFAFNPLVMSELAAVLMSQSLKNAMNVNPFATQGKPGT